MNDLSISQSKSRLARALRAPVLAAALIAPAGCIYLKEMIGLGPQRPKVTVTDVLVKRASIKSLDLEVALRVDNPNDFNLDFSKLRYSMVTDDLEVAFGTYDQAVTVPKQGRALIKLPLTVDARNAIKLLKDLLTRKDEVVAVLKATADFSTPFGVMEVDFEDRRPLKKLAGL